MTDIFHEVEEDVRKERYEKLWKSYGAYLIFLATTLIVGVAGWQAWQTYDLSRRQEISTRFDAQIRELAAGNSAQAEERFAALVAEAPAGYAALANYRLAEAQLAQGKRDQAIATLRTLTEETDLLLNAPARLRLAWLVADSAPRTEIDALLAPLDTPDSAWRFAAAEVRAYVDLQAGNRVAAEAAFQGLAIDPGAAEGLRQRAGAIAQFLRANRPAGPIEPSESEGAPSPAAAPAQENEPQ